LERSRTLSSKEKDESMDNALREIRRVRHETRQRLLTIAETGDLTPRMRRVSLMGADLAGFTSPGFDDHVKVFFPSAGGPTDEGAKRDFTPRYDADAAVLHIDFAIHDAGPASDWARSAKPGQQLRIGGPRGSAIIPRNFDWHLLIGDEVALPAIGRRLEELPYHSRAVVIVEVEDAAEEQRFLSKADIQLQWIHRNGRSPGTSTNLLAALRDIEWPRGEFFAWAAAESDVARAIRRFLVEERGASKGWVKAAGYWKRGAAAIHDRIED
jgi:NADPH-dependent ferric siderophore reductase